MLFHHLTLNSGHKIEVKLNYALGKPPFAQYFDMQEGPFSLSNFTHRFLFDNVSIPNIIHLINIIFLERKIILVSENYGSIAQIIEQLLSLMMPFDYVFTNISFIGKSMTDFIDSPQPFIIGMSRDTWSYYSKSNAISSELNILDLDKGIFITKENIPLFPKSEASRLMNGLSMAIQHVNKTNESWLFASLQIKKAMLNFLLKIVKNYLEFTTKTADCDCGMSATGFNNEKYLMLFKGDHLAYMKEFCNTQCFATLIDKTYKIMTQSSDRSALYWFIHYVKLKSDILVKEEVNRAISKLMSFLHSPLQFRVVDIYMLYQKYRIPPQHATKIEYNNTLYINHQDIVEIPKISYDHLKKTSQFNQTSFMQTSDALYSHTIRYKKADIYSPITMKFSSKKANSSLTSRADIPHYSGNDKENVVGNINDEEIACEFKEHEISIADSFAVRSKVNSPCARDKKRSITHSIDYIKLRSLSNPFDTNKLDNIEATPPLRISTKMEKKRLLETLSSAALIEKRNKLLLEVQKPDGLK